MNKEDPQSRLTFLTASRQTKNMVTNTEALEKPHLLKHFQGVNYKMLMMKRGHRK
jgi:hypothetical protein